ncbi:hypothetical protein QJQ45_029296 [Haematococcus lacustris]|nr:hypothetical protein QJQ45_029296 [Haematococcus lacustris]
MEGPGDFACPGTEYQQRYKLVNARLPKSGQRLHRAPTGPRQQPAATGPGPSTRLPAKRNTRTEAEQAAEPSQPTRGKGKAQGKAAKAKPAPQPDRWVDRDCNAALNMQRIGESKWRPLELCYWPEQGALHAKGKEYPGLGYKRLEEDMAELSMKRHNRAKQLVVFFGAASIGTGGGWGADAVLRACRKVVCRPKGKDQDGGRVVLVDEHRTSRVSSAVNGKQPCEVELNTLSATRPAGWKPPAGQVEQRLVRPAWSQERGQPVRGLVWCPVVAPRRPPQAPRSGQAATQPAASEPGPSTPQPAKRSKRTKAEPGAAEPTKGKAQGKAAKAKPAPQPGRWLDRDCNAALNMQRIGESRWRPLELCYWPDQGALPAKGKEYPGLGYKRLRDKPPKPQEQQQQPAEAHEDAQQSACLYYWFLPHCFARFAENASPSNANLMYIPTRPFRFDNVTKSLRCPRGGNESAPSPPRRVQPAPVAVGSKIRSRGRLSRSIGERRQVIKAALRGLVEAARPDLSPAQVNATVAEIGDAMELHTKASVLEHLMRGPHHRGIRLLPGEVAVFEQPSSAWPVAMLKQLDEEHLWGDLNTLNANATTIITSIQEFFQHPGRFISWWCKAVGVVEGGFSRALKKHFPKLVLGRLDYSLPDREHKWRLPPNSMLRQPRWVAEVAKHRRLLGLPAQWREGMDSIGKGGAGRLPLEKRVRYALFVNRSLEGWQTPHDTCPRPFTMLPMVGVRARHFVIDDKLEEDMAEVSMQRHGQAKQLVVFFGAASIGTRGGWGADEQGALHAKGKEYPGLGYKRVRDKPPKAQEQQQPAEAQAGAHQSRGVMRRCWAVVPQHLAAASSAGTSLVDNLKHITVTLATWDAVWEVYLDPKWARQRLRLYGAQDRALEQFFNKLEKEMAELSMKRHNRAKQLVVFFGAASIGTGGGWGADAVLRACRKVVCRPKGKDQDGGRVVLVDEHRTSRVSSAVNGKQPCEVELNTLSATRPAGWKPTAGQVEERLVRPAWSQERGQPVRGLVWCPVVAPRRPPQAPCSGQAATQPAASEPGPSTPQPAKRSKRTKAEPGAAEPTKGKAQGKVVKAKPAPQPGRWLDRDCNATLNMQRIGESRWRPLELCYWPEQGALPAKGKEYPGLGYKRLRDKPPKAQEQQQQPAEAHFPNVSETVRKCVGTCKSVDFHVSSEFISDVGLDVTGRGMAIGRGSRGGRRGSGISTGAGTQQVANRGGIATGLARGRGSVQKAGRGGQQFTGGRGEGRRGGRGRGGRSGRGRGKPRSAADLDDDLNGYFMRDKDQGAKHLDQELDEYFKTKPTNQAKPAAVATEPAAAEVQRLRDVEQSLMGTVDGFQGDLDDLQAAHQRLQGTTPGLAVPAGAPPQQQQQLAAASTSRKREAPAANKSRAAKQAKRSKPAAEPTRGKGKAQGKAAKAKPAPQPGRWLDRDCNAAVNMQRIGESRWRPLELCYWPDQGALPAKGKEYPGLGYKRLRDKPPKAQEQQQPAEAQ